jgi:sugar phosphate isomerase/epimerase
MERRILNSKSLKKPSGRKSNNPARADTSRYAVTVPFDSLPDHIAFLKSNRLNVEIMMYATNWIRAYPHNEVKAMGERLEAEGIEVSIHGPLFDLNPGSQDTIIRDYTKFNFMRCLNISALLKASIVVFHLGLNPLTPQDYRDAWLRTSMKTWKPVVSHAGRLGITIALENMFLNEPHLLRKVIDMVDDPHMQACLDVGHVNVYSVVPLEEWIQALAGNIVKIHINDNDGRNDLHLPFGEGNVDYAHVYKLLRQYRVNALMTLEMAPDKLPQTLSYIDQHGLNLPLA